MIAEASLQTYDGPLDVLLQLAERGRMDIATIAMGHLTGEYLLHVESLKSTLAPESLAEFIRLGARLTYMKSLSLLPRMEDRAEEAEAVAELTAELAEYRRYRLAARELGKRLKHSSWSRQHPSFPKITSEPSINGNQLADILTRILRRLPPTLPVGTLAALPSQAAVRATLQERIGVEAVRLSQIIAEANTRFDVIMVFVAVLELIAAQVVTVASAGRHDVYLQAIHA